MPGGDEARDRLYQFRRRRAGVAGYHAHTGFQRGMGEGLVAHEQLLRHTAVLSFFLGLGPMLRPSRA